MSEQLALFGNRLLVKPIEKERSSEPEKTASGLFLPQVHEDPSSRLHRGEVVGVGDEVTKVKPGDMVIYDQMGPSPFKVGGETYQMLGESNLIGVYK